jgi:hypothetical protein
MPFGQLTMQGMQEFHNRKRLQCSMPADKERSIHAVIVPYKTFMNWTNNASGLCYQTRGRGRGDSAASMVL